MGNWSSMSSPSINACSCRSGVIFERIHLFLRSLQILVDQLVSLLPCPSEQARPLLLVAGNQTDAHQTVVGHRVMNPATAFSSRANR
jgi:hypothetical protein